MADIAEDGEVLGPGDHGARAHDGGEVTRHEGVAGEVGERDHLGQQRVVRTRRFRLDDLDLGIMREIVQRRDDAPAVHLALVELLGAVIEAGRIAEADGVGRREQTEVGVRRDHAVLVEQGELARAFENALDDEHHVRAAGIVFVEHDGDGALQGPRKNAFAEFGDLLAILQDDGVLADHVDPADMAVEVDADHRPVEAGGDLLDMGRFAGAVIALHHDAAVELEAGQDGERGLGVEPVGGVDLRHVFGARLEAVHDHGRVEAEQLLEVQLLGGFQAFERIGGRH